MWGEESIVGYSKTAGLAGPAQPRHSGDGPGRAPRCRRCSEPEGAAWALPGRSALSTGFPATRSPACQTAVSKGLTGASALAVLSCPVATPPLRGKSPALPINFLMSRESGKTSYPPGWNPPGNHIGDSDGWFICCHCFTGQCALPEKLRAFRLHIVWKYLWKNPICPSFRPIVTHLWFEGEKA